MKKIKLLLSLFLLFGGVVYSQTNVQSFQIPTQKDKFSARFTASASADSVNTGVGFGGEEIENWSGMNAIVSFGGSGSIVVRDGSAYAAEIDYPYKAGVSYFFDMDVDILNQTYSVSVRLQDDLTPTVLATNYGFRMDKFHDSIAYFSSKSSHSLGTGFVGVSDFQMSNTPQTSAKNFNQPINKLSGEFGVKVVATPLAKSTGYFGLSTNEIADGQLNLLGVVVQFNDAGEIKVGNGTSGYAADVIANYVPGEPHMFLIDGNIDSLTYNVKVVMPDLSVIDLATGYEIGSSFSGQSFNYFVTSTLSDEQYIAIDGIEAGRVIYESNGNPTVSSEIGSYTQAFSKSITVRTSHGAGMNGALGLNKNEAVAWGDFNTIVNFQIDQTIAIRNGGSYVNCEYVWDQGEVFQVQFDMDPAQGKYSVSLDDGIYVTPVVVAADYDFRNTDGDTINYITTKCNWSTAGNIVGAYLILNDVAITMPDLSQVSEETVNLAPTIDDVADVTDNDVVEGTFDIDLSGITDGDDGSQELNIIVTSSDNNLATVAIDYVSPNTTGIVLVTPIAKGNVTITITVKDNGGTDNGGVDETTISFDIDLIATGVTKYQLDAINLFPNPATDRLQLSDVENISKIEIYNIIGAKVIEREIINETDIVINVSNIDAGTYLVKFYNEITGKISISKFVKE